MPELPEIETIKNGLRRFVLNKEIKNINFLDKKLIISNLLKVKIKNNFFIEIERLGKLLIFDLKFGDLKLLIHLKMTGQLIFCSNKATNNKIMVAGGHSDQTSDGLNCKDLKYLRLEIVFKNGDKLFLNDSRRFAYVKIINLKDFKKIKEKFGLEPLSKDFLFLDFTELLNRRERKNIKAFLLDQSLVAGIGNIYADEILFASGIRPDRKVGNIKEKERYLLFKNIKKIIKLAVEKRGTTFSDYVDAEGRSGGFFKLLKVYGRAGKKCKKCHDIIKKIKISGRGTHYCPHCQNI